MIAFACPACKRQLSVKDEFAGKRGNCPHCKQTVLVPVSLADAVTAAAGPDDTPSSSDAGEAKLDFLAKAQAADELGRLGQYRVLKVLGAGGMGMVLLADNPILKRKVALKVMRPEVAADKNARQRFLHEAQATAALDHHHIIAIHQVGQEKGVPFIVMPLLKGEPLDVRLKRETRLPIADAVTIAKQTAEGLAEAHKAGLVHRDIKPANIWLQPETHGLQSVGFPRVKILDFGLARGGGEDLHLTRTGAILGTPAYMAPEQAKSQQVDFRCDLFSLGAVMYRMLTGELPFKGHDAMSMLMSLATETPKPVQVLNPEVPPALAKLVMRMLAKEPEQRPASAKAVAETLGALAGEQTVMLASGGRQPPVGTIKPLNGQTGGLRPPLAKRFASLLWSLRPWAFRRPGLAFAVEAVVLLSFLLLILLPFASHKTKEATTTPKSRDREGAIDNNLANSLGMKFVLVPKGKFLMGGGGNGNAAPKEVEIKQDFQLGQYEVTQWEWMQVMGNNPSYFKNPPAAKPLSQEERAKLTLDDLQKLKEQEERDKENYWKSHPVENVSWEECQEYIKRLNQKEKTPGWVYRLPTEAEWEYACRGGGGRPVLEYGFDYYFEQPTNNLLPEMANFKDSGKNGTCKVGSYQPNRLGLYDMHGNVCEWCQDEIPGDPKDPKAGSQRVLRGGGRANDSKACRAANRLTSTPSSRYHDPGLRLARVPVGQVSK